MADQRIQHTEDMTGANHATKPDTLNRLTLVEHTEEGAHIPSYGELYEFTPAGSVLEIPTAGDFVNWDTGNVGLEAGAGFVVGTGGVGSKFVIGALGGGLYRLFEHAVYTAPVGDSLTMAAFLNDNQQLKFTEPATLGGATPAFPDSVDVKVGTIGSGTVDDVKSQDATYLQIDETNNEDTGFIIDFAFSGIGVPKQINFVGQYSGAGGHSVEVQIFDFTATVNDVQNGGTAYRCIRSHTSAASNEPGVGAQWPSYWESIGAAGGEPAWVTATPYTDGFVDVRAATQDIPNSTTDIERHWLVPGDLATRKNYVDVSGNSRVRIFHTSSGATAHDIFIDLFSIDDDQGSKSVTTSGFIQLAATDELDLKFTADMDNEEIEIISVNFWIERFKIL